MIQKIKKMVPVDFIRFDNGVEVPLQELYNNVLGMSKVTCTTFDKKDEIDMAVLDWLKSYIEDERQQGYIEENDELVKIHWCYNYALVAEMLKDLIESMVNENESNS